MMEVPELQGMESSPMDLVDILWLQDVDMGAGREVFDLQLRQKENDLRRQREEKEKERMRLLKQEEEELLQKLQLDEETGEFLPRPLPPSSVTMGTGSGIPLDTIFDSSLSFEECMELLAESFPLEEVIQDPLPESPSTNPAPSVPPAVSPVPAVTAPLTPNRRQAKALSAPAPAPAPVPAPALRQPTPVSQNPMLSALLVPRHGPLNVGRIQPLPPALCTTPAPPAPLAPTIPQPTPLAPIIPQPARLAPTIPQPTPLAPTITQPTPLAPTIPQPTRLAPTIPQPTRLAPTIPQPTPLAPTIPQPTPAPASGTLDPADDMEALVELLSLPELQSVNLQVSAILQQNGFSDATLPPLAEDCNYNLYQAVVPEPCPQAHSTHTTAYTHPAHTLFTQSSHTHSTPGEMEQSSDGGDSRLVSDLLSQLLSSETQSDQNLLCSDTQLIVPTKDLLCSDTQLPISTKDLLCSDTPLPIPTKDLLCSDTQLPIPNKDVHIQDTHLDIQNKDLVRDADIFNKDVSMPDHSYTPQPDSRPESCNVSPQPAEGSTEEGSYCLMELEDLALFSLEGFDTISPLGGAGDSPDSGLAIEAGFTSSPSSSSEATPNHNEEEGFVGFSESDEEEEEMDIGGLYGQSDAKEVSSSASLTNQALPHDGDLIEGRRHGKRPLTKDKTRRSRQTRDEQRARALNIPFPVDRIVNMAVDDFNDLVSRHQLNESQLSLVRDIRRRGKNKVAAQNCRKRKMESISGLEEELQALQDDKGRLLQQRTQTQSTLSGLKQQLGSLCLEVFSLVRDEMGIPYSPRDYSLQQTSDGTMFMVPRLKKSPKV